MDHVETQKKLGEIWKKLGSGTPIEFLPIADIEFLARHYGDNWKSEVKRKVWELQEFSDS